MMTISKDTIRQFEARLAAHPIYAAIATMDDLRCFMEHHVYSVWDFMSLIKFLQSVVAPAAQPWVPRGDGDVRRFINELVLEEESDENPLTGGHSSHFEIYLQAMQEIGADTAPVRAFVEQVAADGITAALEHSAIPEPSRAFTRTTFGFIAAGGAHRAAAALALGREHVIPGMFRAILARIGVDAQTAPTFHSYLNRHIHLDEDFHAPLSLRLLNGLCEDASQVAAATEAAQRAVAARLAFWDGVLATIRARQAA
jgi:hypothetical protein